MDWSNVQYIDFCGISIDFLFSTKIVHKWPIHLVWTSFFSRTSFLIIANYLLSELNYIHIHILFSKGISEFSWTLLYILHINNESRKIKSQATIGKTITVLYLLKIASEIISRYSASNILPWKFHKKIPFTFTLLCVKYISLNFYASNLNFFHLT